MPDNLEHNKNYTLADINRYLKGEMNPDEKYLLEKAALDDPFLADAIEGYKEAELVDATMDVTELQQRLNERSSLSKRERKAGKVWWSMAAAVLLLMSVFGVRYLIQNPSDKMMSENMVESAEVQDSSVALAAPAEHENADTAAGISADQMITSAPAKKTAPSVVASSPAKVQEDKSGRVMSDKAQLEELPMEAAPLKAESVSLPPKYIFKGKVTDGQDRGLPYVNIRTPSVDTFTNLQGDFVFADSSASVDVSVRSEGYATVQKIFSGTDTESHIRLQLLARQSKKTAVRDLAKVKEKQITEAQAVPEAGMAAYRIYLENNKRLPATGNEKAKGSVTVSFMVDQSGKLYDFKIENSTCVECNEEALRLVREGPGWKSISSGSAKAQIQIDF